MEKNIGNLIRGYLRNSISMEELTFLKKWVSKKENQAFFRDFLYTYYKGNVFDTEKNLGLFESKAFGKKPLALQRRNRFSFVKYAAIFIGILTCGYFVYYYNQKPIEGFPATEVTLEVEGVGTQILDISTTKDLAGKNGMVLARQKGNTLDYVDSDQDSTAITFNVLKVPYGKTFQVLLSDQTHVYLNAGSSLRYPTKFIKGHLREVFLEGEGYFKVGKDKESPFIVRANGISTEVFGTEFNISSYSNDQSTQVVLIEGSIGVFDKGNRFDSQLHKVLKPNEMASKEIGKSISVSNVDVRGHIAWIDGTLLFRNEGFGTIARKLQRHYNVNIINNDETLGDKKFTGRFDVETVDQVLRTFQKTNSFNYKIEGSNITINP
ncbi:MAG: hypothetical protein CR994_04485 [Maribacter sp.]|nr:MAG: hypothetical protein CR994_04485 [Maribacter sp.]